MALFYIFHIQQRAAGVRSRKLENNYVRAKTRPRAQSVPVSVTWHLAWRRRRPGGVAQAQCLSTLDEDSTLIPQPPRSLLAVLSHCLSPHVSAGKPSHAVCCVWPSLLRRSRRRRRLAEHALYHLARLRRSNKRRPVELALRRLGGATSACSHSACPPRAEAAVRAAVRAAARSATCAATRSAGGRRPHVQTVRSRRSESRTTGKQAPLR